MQGLQNDMSPSMNAKERKRIIAAIERKVSKLDGKHLAVLAEVVRGIKTMEDRFQKERDVLESKVLTRTLKAFEERIGRKLDLHLSKVDRALEDINTAAEKVDATAKIMAKYYRDLFRKIHGHPVEQAPVKER